MNGAVFAALKTLLSLLAQCEAPDRASFIQLLYPDGRIELFPVRDSIAASKAAAPVDPARPPLSDREKAALAVLARAERPLKGRTIAARAGLRYTSHFRELMAGLVRKGLVITTSERLYWPASKEVPPVAD